MRSIQGTGVTWHHFTRKLKERLLPALEEIVSPNTTQFMRAAQRNLIPGGLQFDLFIANLSLIERVGRPHRFESWERLRKEEDGRS